MSLKTSWKNFNRCRMKLQTDYTVLEVWSQHSHPLDPHWLPVSKRIKFKILLLTFKALHQQSPTYIQDLMTRYLPSRSLRSSSTLSLNPVSFHLKSFCLRDRGRLGNRGRPIWLKFGTLSYYGDLCNMPRFQLYCSYLGWVLDGTLFGVPQCFFYSPFWALFNTLITMSGIF